MSKLNKGGVLAALAAWRHSYYNNGGDIEAVEAALEAYIAKVAEPMPLPHANLALEELLTYQRLSELTVAAATANGQRELAKIALDLFTTQARNMVALDRRITLLTGGKSSPPLFPDSHTDEVRT
jgi:hypothetical protein